MIIQMFANSNWWTSLVRNWSSGSLLLFVLVLFSHDCHQTVWSIHSHVFHDWDGCLTWFHYFHDIIVSLKLYPYAPSRSSNDNANITQANSCLPFSQWWYDLQHNFSCLPSKRETHPCPMFSILAWLSFMFPWMTWRPPPISEAHLQYCNLLDYFNSHGRLLCYVQRKGSWDLFHLARMQ
jgi:hypothetical protein